MGFKTLSLLKQLYLPIHKQSLQYSNLTLQLFVNKRQKVRNPYKIASVVCVYSSDNKKHFINIEKKADALKDVLEHRKEQIKDTEQRLRQKGVEFVRDIKHQKEITEQKIKVKKDFIIKDILETKAKVREKIEEVVEVIVMSIYL